MTRLQDVNLPLVMSLLRPGVPYHFAGSGDFGNTLDAVREMTKPPTEAEVLAKWDEIKDTPLANPPVVAAPGKAFIPPSPDERLVMLEEAVQDALLGQNTARVPLVKWLRQSGRLSADEVQTLVAAGKLTAEAAEQLEQDG